MGTEKALTFLSVMEVQQKSELFHCFFLGAYRLDQHHPLWVL
ncbi:hypothetical protein [Comamonas testosteroni]|nr:hypothetical protein [Comamonas testosteroni]